MPDAQVELYVSSGCEFCDAARDDLEWRGVDFVEYNVDTDRDAHARMLGLTDGSRTVPVLVEDGKVTAIGWMGRGCIV